MSLKPNLNVKQNKTPPPLQNNNNIVKIEKRVISEGGQRHSSQQIQRKTLLFSLQRALNVRRQWNGVGCGGPILASVVQGGPLLTFVVQRHPLFAPVVQEHTFIRTYARNKH